MRLPDIEQVKRQRWLGQSREAGLILEKGVAGAMPRKRRRRGIAGRQGI
ncbi:MAG TPA: hypothetical protein VFI31_07855 [Pirellulales bacterium]|nr:hypothetical protein [Pirellulales bacterium]